MGRAVSWLASFEKGSEFHFSQQFSSENLHPQSFNGSWENFSKVCFSGKVVLWSEYVIETHTRMHARTRTRVLKYKHSYTAFPKLLWPQNTCLCRAEFSWRKDRLELDNMQTSYPRGDKTWTTYGSSSDTHNSVSSICLECYMHYLI